MKKLVCLLFALCLLSALTACGAKEPFTVTVRTVGTGKIAYASKEKDLGLENAYGDSVYLGLPRPETCVFGAKVEDEDWHFVRWMKNGEEISTEPVITVELNGDADFVAVFEPTGPLEADGS